MIREDNAAATLGEVLAGALLVSARMLPSGDAVAIRVTLGPVPPALAGRTLQLRLGAQRVLDLPIPAGPPAEVLEFGPVDLPLGPLRRQREFALLVAEPAREPEALGVVQRIEGEFLEALRLPTPDEFFARLQLHETRYRDPRILLFGCLAAYGRFAEFEVRAASLTITAHRLLERDLTALTEDELALMRWVTEEARNVVGEGAAALAGAADPPWTLIRWTVSLASASGLLAVILDRLDEAAWFFETAANQMPLVRIAPVCALNLILASLFAGLLLGMADRPARARELLLGGIRGFPEVVAAQDITRSIWVLGDLADANNAARMCFIALARMGLLEPTGYPRIAEDIARLDLGDVKSPLGAILRAGFAPRFAGMVAEYAARPIDPRIIM